MKNLGNRNDVAIIGAACRLPGNIKDTDQFWTLLHQGRDAVCKIPSERDQLIHSLGEYFKNTGETPIDQGGFLDQVFDFDPDFFNISPREAHKIDPQHRMLLEVIWEALESAGQSSERLEGSATGIYVGISQNDYAQYHLNSAPHSELDVHDSSGNPLCFAAGRAAFYLGTRGPTCAIDTACSSSLVALHLAVQALRGGECNLALAAGVNLILSPEIFVCLSKAGVLAPDGRCRAFDAASSGFGRGEGCVALVLKRLEEAQAADDDIWAIIRGSAINHDGRAAGLTVPNGKAQQELLLKAFQSAGVTPAEIDYLEAHGTGTALGDPIELKAINSVFKDSHSSRAPLYIGSVKTNLAHLEAASGLAGVLKTILALRHAEIPAQVHFTNPTQHFDWNQTCIEVPPVLTQWPRSKRSRIAGVSSFGMSGTNAHVIVEEGPERGERELKWRGVGVLTISSRSGDALKESLEKYERFLGEERGGEVADICYTSNVGRKHFEQRVAVVGRSRNELRQRVLERLKEGKGEVGGEGRKIVFLCTGQGSQYVGMCRELYEQEESFREVISRCSEAVKRILPCPLEEVLYGKEGGVLEATRYAQPALYAVENGVAAVWRKWGIEPEIVIGHSLGEYVAATIAGVMSLEAGARLVAERGRMMDELPRTGTMYSVGAEEEWVKEAIKRLGADRVSIASLNGKWQTVISGEREQIAEVVAECEIEGVASVELKVSHAFHSVLMKPMVEAYERVVAETELKAPQLKMISNVSGAVAGTEVTTARYWAEQVLQPVRFGEGIVTAVREGGTLMVELGPKAVLSGIGKRCAANENARWIASVEAGKSSIETMLQAAAQLYERGLEIDWGSFHSQSNARRLQLPTYPFQRKTYCLNVRNDRPYSSHTGLLGSRIPLPGSSEIRFSCDLADPLFKFLDDHRLKGVIVVPGALYVASILEAAPNLFGESRCIISELLFRKPLILSDQRDSALQYVFKPQSLGQWSCQVFSVGKTNGQTENTLHAEGIAQPYIVGSPENLPETQKQRATLIELEQFYDQFWSAGYQIGPHFRWLEKVSQQTGFSRSILRAAHEDERLPMHPGLIDSLFQAFTLSGAVKLLRDDGDLLIPIALDNLIYHGAPLNQGASCDAQSNEVTALGVRGTFSVCDMQGALLLSVQNLEIHCAKSEEFRVEKFELQVVEERWVATTETPNLAARARWFIFGPDRKVLDQLSCEIELRGERIAGQYQVVNQDFPRMVQNLVAEIERICAEDRDAILQITWLLGGEAENARAPQAAYQFNMAIVEGLFSLVHEILIRHLDRQVRFTIVGSDSKPFSPWQELCHGIIRTLAQESDLCSPRFIAIRNGSPLSTEILADELKNQDSAEILYSHGQRLKRTFVKDSLSTTKRVLQLRRDGTYLITGGLGALGLIVAEHFSKSGAARIILVGRSAPSKEALQRIERMCQRGVFVEVCQCDVGDYNTLNDQVFRKTAQELPLCGIVHAAGELYDGLLGRHQTSRFIQGLQAKVAGALHLDRLSRSCPLDFFICFSSIAALFGAAAQASYTAANCFLDELMRERHSAGFPGLSIQWGPWRGPGMATRLSQSAQIRANALGLRFIDPSEALEALPEIIARGKPVLAVVAGTTRVNLEAFVGTNPILYGGSVLAPALIDKPVNRQDLFVGVATLLAQVLGRDDVFKNGSQSLIDSGLDSLTAMEFRQAARTAFEIDLGIGEILQQSTLNELVDKIEAKRKDGKQRVDLSAKVELNKSHSTEGLSHLNAQDLLQHVDQLTDPEVDQLLKVMAGEEKTK